MSNYSFSYFNRDTDREYLSSEFPVSKGVTTNLEFDDAATWDAVLTEFLHFLSSIYGYDIADHVTVQSFEHRMSVFKDLEDQDESTEGREFN